MGFKTKNIFESLEPKVPSHKIAHINVCDSGKANMCCGFIPIYVEKRTVLLAKLNNVNSPEDT